MRETDRWPFIQAKWFEVSRPGRAVQFIVIHDEEFPERPDSAEVIAHDFSTRPSTNKGSAHVCVDNNSIIQCVRDNNIAYAAGHHGNLLGIHIELSGYGRQTRTEWLDVYGIAMIALGADVTAQYCLKYGLPPVFLSSSALLAGQKGITGHVQVTDAWKESDHRDPGPNFPWDYFLGHVISAYQSRL